MLIDSATLKEPIKPKAGSTLNNMRKAELIKEDAADVAPVVHGRWINPPLYGIGVCAFSHCKDKSQIFVFSNGEISEKFCPLCGARMDGDDDAKAD